MDIVYVFSLDRSNWRGQELVYSLRSLMQYGKNFDRIFIIGKLPYNLQEDKKRLFCIPEEDNKFYFGNRNIANKLLSVSERKEISDNFIMFNDDYFLTKEIDFKKLPYYYQYDLSEKIKNRREQDLYYRAMKNTYLHLTKLGLPTLHFDIHYPIVYNKKLIKEIINSVNWESNGGYVIKSLYCNTLKIEGIYKEDVKISIVNDKNSIYELIAKTDLYSTGDLTTNMKLIIQNSYIEPTCWEI